MIHTFFQVLLKKKKTLSSWTVSLHALNIWTVFYLREAVFLGSSWIVNLLGIESTLPRYQGYKGLAALPCGRMALLWSISEWIVHRGWRRDLSIMLQLTGLCKVSSRVVPRQSVRFPSFRENDLKWAFWLKESTQEPTCHFRKSWAVCASLLLRVPAAQWAWLLAVCVRKEGLSWGYLLGLIC